MITYAWKFNDIAEYNDTFVVHLRLSCKESHKKCFFLIYITIVRIDENKAYRHGGLYTSGRGQLIIFFYHSNTNTNRVSDNQSYLWKKVFKYTKSAFFQLCSPGHSRSQRVKKAYGPILLFWHRVPLMSGYLTLPFSSPRYVSNTKQEMLSKGPYLRLHWNGCKVPVSLTKI